MTREEREALLVSIAVALDRDVRQGERCPVCGSSPHTRSCLVVAALTTREGK